MIQAPLLPGTRRIVFFAFLFSCLIWRSSGQEPLKPGESKLVTLESKEIKVVIRIGPDQVGLNSRFDRTGRVISLKIDGREFLGTGGMPDDFGMMGAGALGYSEAAEGEPFLKMGVGLLHREGGAFYRFKKNYKVQELASVTVVEQTPTSLEVLQKGASIRGYAVEYRKKYTVHPAGALEIRYMVQNIGSRGFEFEQFNHNWFAMGRENPGSGVVIDWGRPQKDTAASWLKAEGSSLRLLGPTTDEPGYTFYMPSANEEKPADIRIVDEQTGLQMHLTTSFVPSREVLYIDAEGICPEICYYDILSPGESTTWTRTFTASIARPPRQNDDVVK